MIALGSDHAGLPLKMEIIALLKEMNLEYKDYGTYNKVKGIRCACCSDCYSAKMTRMHNDANMLAMGARVVGVDLGRMIAEIFLTTGFEGGRHQRRIDQIMAIEAGETL